MARRCNRRQVAQNNGSVCREEELIGEVIRSADRLCAAAAWSVGGDSALPCLELSLIKRLSEKYI